MSDLDPDDPVDAVLIKIHELNRRKRSDYAYDGDPFSNFDGSARRLGVPGVTGLEACEFLIATKEERLAALRANGRPPANESVADSYLDRAVYAVIACAILQRDIDADWDTKPNRPPLGAVEESRCQHVSPSPWGPSQCALPEGHAEPHAYSPSEKFDSDDRPARGDGAILQRDIDSAEGSE